METHQCLPRIYGIGGFRGKRQRKVDRHRSKIMTKHIHRIHNDHVPTIEIDSVAASAYVRFKSSVAIAKTTEITPSVLVDTDQLGELIGVELLYLPNSSLRGVQERWKSAGSLDPEIDWEGARIIQVHL